MEIIHLATLHGFVEGNQSDRHGAWRSTMTPDLFQIWNILILAVRQTWTEIYISRHNCYQFPLLLTNLDIRLERTQE